MTFSVAKKKNKRHSSHCRGRTRILWKFSFQADDLFIIIPNSREFLVRRNWRSGKLHFSQRSNKKREAVNTRDRIVSVVDGSHKSIWRQVINFHVTWCNFFLSLLHYFLTLHECHYHRPSMRKPKQCQVQIDIDFHALIWQFLIVVKWMKIECYFYKSYNFLPLNATKSFRNFIFAIYF